MTWSLDRSRRVVEQAESELGLQERIEFVSNIEERLFTYTGHRRKLHYVKGEILGEELGPSGCYMSG